MIYDVYHITMFKSIKKWYLSLEQIPDSLHPSFRSWFIVCIKDQLFFERTFKFISDCLARVSYIKFLEMTYNDIDNNFADKFGIYNILPVSEANCPQIWYFLIELFLSTKKSIVEIKHLWSLQAFHDKIV